MESTKLSLSRTLSLPRRCRICGKIVYFRSFRCRFCNLVSHRQCLDQPLKDHLDSAVEPTVKIERSYGETIQQLGAQLQDNCVHHHHQHQHFPMDDLATTPESPNTIRSGIYQRFVSWLTHHKIIQQNQPPTQPRFPCEKYGRGSYKGHLHHQHQHNLQHPQQNSDNSLLRSLKLSISPSKKLSFKKFSDHNVKKPDVTSSRACPCHVEVRQLHHNHRQDSGIGSLSSSVVQTPSCGDNPRGSASGGECLQMLTSSTSSTSSSTSNTTFSNWRNRFTPLRSIALSSSVPTTNTEAGRFNHQRKRKSFVRLARGVAGGELTSTITCEYSGFWRSRCTSVNKRRTRSLETKDGMREELCATWPPVGHYLFLINTDVFDGNLCCYEEENAGSVAFELAIQSDNVKRALCEWNIPFQDLKFGKRVRNGRRHDIYKGQWHGEVMIHIFNIESERETSQFWKDVSALSMIRHENLALFMGVCINLPQLAIVTCVRKGRSLYYHIHVKKDHYPLHTKVNIARHVAQGMSYLHAKGIVHRKLNSKNILMENRVKICLLDQGMAEKRLDRFDYGCIPNGHLTYVSPEMMRSLTVLPPRTMQTIPSTKSSDVFAFGTVLYELFAEQWPFQGQVSHCIMWQVGNGHIQSLKNIKCSHGIKNLLSQCWSSEANCRPNFHQILKVVQENVLLHRRHSTSEPENLNRLGFTNQRFPCSN
ncbi:hypothetical protein CHUAL_006563 [Chamberlinius hualienensis]